VWCGIASFREKNDAEAFMQVASPPIRGRIEPVEHWRALLLPFAQRGECNHLSSACDVPLYETHPDSGGSLFVMTTAGFNLRAKSDFKRLIDFRTRVERMRQVIETVPGNLGHQVFAPVTPQEDGVTMSVWRDDASMFNFAYKAGSHRAELDRQKAHQTVDRSSFTRFRILTSYGHWRGRRLTGAQ
jgi:heme-degrading monooxygenase HmoA